MNHDLLVMLIESLLNNSWNLNSLKSRTVADWVSPWVLIENSFNNSAPIACCALAPRLEDKWKLAIDDWLTTKLWQLAQDQTDPAVHQSFKITILLGPPCSSKQWCKVTWTSWNKMLEIAETFSMSLSMAGRASQTPIESPTSTKDPYLRTACFSLTDAQKIPTWIMDVNIKGRTNERILREHVQRIWGSQRDCLRMVE